MKQISIFLLLTTRAPNAPSMGHVGIILTINLVENRKCNAVVVERRIFLGFDRREKYMKGHIYKKYESLKIKILLFDF